MRPGADALAALVAGGLGLVVIGRAVTGEVRRAALPMAGGALALAAALVLAGWVRWPDGGNGGEVGELADVLDLSAWRAAA